MNYLAHLYLSGEDEDLMTGNFIGDYIKGKDYLQYPERIKQGILMHRRIDAFTDSHKHFREVRKLFREEFGLYSGVITDLLYDHLLAENWGRYAPCTLREFSKTVHAILLSHYRYLPLRVQQFLPFLIQHKRLESYATRQGIKNSLERMSHYTSLPGNAPQAIDTFELHSVFVEKNFATFMVEIMDYVESCFGVELKKPETCSGL